MRKDRLTFNILTLSEEQKQKLKDRNDAAFYNNVINLAKDVKDLKLKVAELTTKLDMHLEEIL